MALRGGICEMSLFLHHKFVAMDVPIGT